jgi:putative oxidoreductase
MAAAAEAIMLKRFLRTDNDLAALFMRLALGLVMFPHGAQKVLGWWGGHGAAATIQGFSRMGLPGFVTVLVMLAEFLGSLLLIFGFLTRLAAFAIACDMLAALLLVHMNIGFFMNWLGTQKGEGFEFHLLALGLAIALVIKGGGALSVDRAIAGGRDRTGFARAPLAPPVIRPAKSSSADPQL